MKQETKLIDIRKLCPGVVVCIKNNQLALVKRELALKVKKAKESLPSGYAFIITSAWRSTEHQKKIQARFYRKFIKQHPNWSKEKIEKETAIYVAPAEGSNISKHLSGEAVDIFLAKNGRKVPLKSTKLSYQENALSNQKKLSISILKNRQIMFIALKNAGLKNFEKEYWHWTL